MSDHEQRQASITEVLACLEYLEPKTLHAMLDAAQRTQLREALRALHEQATTIGNATIDDATVEVAALTLVDSFWKLLEELPDAASTWTLGGEHDTAADRAHRQAHIEQARVTLKHIENTQERAEQRRQNQQAIHLISQRVINLEQQLAMLDAEKQPATPPPPNKKG